MHKRTQFSCIIYHDGDYREVLLTKDEKNLFSYIKFVCTHAVIHCVSSIKQASNDTSGNMI